MHIFHAVTELVDQGGSGVLCTVIKTKGSTPRHEGSKMLVYEDGRILGSVGGGEVESRVLEVATHVLNAGKPEVLQYEMVDPEKGDPGVCGGTVAVYLEPILPKPKMIIVGGGHVGKALAHQAKWLGYYVVVSDDREEFCDEKSQPDADERIICKMADLPDMTSIHRNTDIVLTTRGTDIDVEGLPKLVNTNARFIGVIGSKRRWAITKQKLMAAGLKQDELNRIVSPLGIEIQAETPEEITISIMAEIIRNRNGGDGRTMREHQGA